MRAGQTLLELKTGKRGRIRNESLRYVNWKLDKTDSHKMLQKFEKGAITEVEKPRGECRNNIVSWELAHLQQQIRPKKCGVNGKIHIKEESYNTRKQENWKVILDTLTCSTLCTLANN